MIYDEYLYKYKCSEQEQENLYWFLILETYIHDGKYSMNFPNWMFSIDMYIEGDDEGKFEIVSLKFLDGQVLTLNLPRVSILVKASRFDSHKSVFVSDGINHNFLTGNNDLLNQWIHFIEHNLMNNPNRYKKLLAE